MHRREEFLEGFTLEKEPPMKLDDQLNDPAFLSGRPARQDGDRLAIEELLERYDGIEITGPIERVQSTFVGSLKHLPVKLKPHVTVV